MTRFADRGATAIAFPEPATTPVISAIARRGAIVVAASGFVALCAHATVPLPFTPVPVVLSDFAVVLVGLLLGPAMGFAALALYLVEGAAGLPVFSPAGLGGVAQLLGPTAGYLYAYPVAAAAAGWIRHSARSLLGNSIATALAAALASAIILLSGAAWLAHFLHLSAAASAPLAIAPFLVGSVIKIAAAVAVTVSAGALRKH